MTSLERFSNLTHDELFENYSISDIKTYQNELQKEVDKKKNEIRVMVGEKYRDFIEVADRIDCMNKLSASITNRIENISASLSTLNLNLDEQELKECQINQDKAIPARNTVAVLIKLLIDIEEQIWIEITDYKFITATTLLQLAVHIKTTLSLEASWQVDKRFPVVSEVWNSILRFPLILTQMVEEKIKVTDLSVADACECLCTLTILENLNCVEVIKRFIGLRTETLKTILNVENVTQNVKTNILGSFQIIINTFEVLYRCFRISETNRGEYWDHIQNMTAPVCEPAIEKVALDFTTKFGKIYIPSSVQNFKVKTNKPIDLVESGEYNKFLDEWLLWIKDYVKPQTVILLNIINSLKTLQMLKESVPLLPHDWLSILKHFSQPEDLNLWNEIYQPLITERAKAVLLDQWNLVFDKICSELEIAINDIINDRAKEPEHDLHWFLWNSFEEDLAEKISQDSCRSVQSLSIKSAGQSPNSGKMCIFIQSLVSDMMKEISDICSDSNPETESQILKLHQQQCCLELIEKLITKVNELASREALLDNVIIYLARVLSGVASLCSSVKQCILLMDDKGAKWQHMCTKLQEESLNIWRKWSLIAPKSILSDYKTCITSSSASSLRIKYFPKWETIKIKEENEDGKEIETEILVPFQASFPLQKLLNSLTSLCSRTLPPKIVVAEMIDSVIVDILTSLESIDEETSQAIFIQYLFDLKYLSELLIPLEKSNLISLSSETISKFERKIDPVDLDTLSIHLSQNVQQHVYRTQGMYGLLINNKPKMVCKQYKDNSEDPNVTYVGTTNVPWFPLLPSTVFPAAKAEDIFRN